MKERGSWKASALALLCTATAAVLCFSSATMCKYTAGGNVAGSARVAKFQPVWEPMNSNWTAVGGFGSLDSGIVLHPGNWTSVQYVHWRCTNRSEVQIRSYIVPRAVYGGAGYYRPASGRYCFNQDLFRAGVQSGSANGNFGNGIVSWTSTGSTMPAGTAATAPSATSPRTIDIGNYDTFYISFYGYNAAPSRPANDVNTGTITAANPIRFGVGSWAMGGNTLTCDVPNNLFAGMDYTWWRTYRVNVDGYDVQVD